ncbi:MAG TPA: hypothetical protein VEI97_18365, partial [bacterium]|nr:hypothetical protein [bacterium]
GQRAIEDLRDDWITGRGPGAHIYKRFWAHESARKEAYLHNGYLWFILKFGVLGVLVIGWVYARFFGVAAKLRLGRDLEPWQRAVTVGYVAVVIPMLIFAWTNNIIAQPGGLYFLLPGLAWFAYLERTALPRSPAPAPADPA